MPIRIKFSDLDFGQIFYLKNDPDGFAYILTGITVLPGNQILFRLSFMGETIQAYDFECSVNPPEESKPEED